MSLIEKIIAAAGGEVWRRPKSLQLSGTAFFSPFGKIGGDSTTLTTYDMKRVFPDQNLAAHSANGKVSFDAFYGADDLFFQLKFNGQSSNIALGKIAKPYAEYFKWSNNFGFGILRFADQEAFTIENLVSDQIEGFDCNFIKVIDPKGHKTFFATDSEKHYIRMVGFTTDLGWHHRIYSDFQVTPSGFVQPMQVRIYFDGIKWVDIKWLEVKVNEDIPNEVFD